MNKQVNKNNGIDFLGVLLLIFITLRLTDHIDWSWWWVMAPLWFPFALVFTIFIIAVIYKGLMK